jgi:hypothetical protein
VIFAKTGYIMRANLRMSGKLSVTELRCTMGASLVCHLALVLLLTSSSSYPAAETDTRFDLIWATPASLPLGVPTAAGTSAGQEHSDMQRYAAESKDTTPNRIHAGAQSPGEPNVHAALVSGTGLAVFTVNGTVTPAPELPRTEPKAYQLEGKKERLPPHQVDSSRKNQPVPDVPASSQLRQNQPRTRAAADALAERRLVRELTDNLTPTAPTKPDRVITTALNDAGAPPSHPVQNIAVRHGRLSSAQRKNTPEAYPPGGPGRADATGAKGDGIPAITAAAGARGKPDSQVPPEPVRKAGVERDRIPALAPELERKAVAYTRKRLEHIHQAAAQQAPAREAPRRTKAAAARPPAPPLPAGNLVAAREKAVGTPAKTAAVAQQKGPGITEKALQQRSPMIGMLRGDLKLVLTGDTDIKLSVKFREYPTSRRNRVLNKTEARRVQVIVPVLTAPREDTREAVIEAAREGIYIFSAEPGDGKETKAAFTLRAYESGSREKTAKLGTRTISGPTVLLKILMPEAILWDDDSTFTGSMEDSESETKFNATTGLYWKEFHQ